MDTLLQFYNAVRERFPEVTKHADVEHINHWHELDPEFAYSWFESLAKAINKDMERRVDVRVHEELFRYIASALTSSNREVIASIDVAFVENLFWRVPEENARPYWLQRPQPLKDLYVAFHHRPPA